MRTVVVKFGGAALKDLHQFQKVACIVSKKRGEYDRVVVVVSAMGKMTDELLHMSQQIMENPPKREQDMLISVGERISMALLAMALYKEGHEAISFTGSQAGIITTPEHADARIIEVKPHRVLRHLEAGKIVIVAGFQGVSWDGEITTLGRGGSDTTAVAMAVALKAERVEFYKDVEGIFTSDPKRDPKAEMIAHLNYAEALAVVAMGERKVIHPRAIELAAQHGIPLCLGSTVIEGVACSYT